MVLGSGPVLPLLAGHNPPRSKTVAWHLPVEMAGWTAPREAWSGGCGSQISAPMPRQKRRVSDVAAVLYSLGGPSAIQAQVGSMFLFPLRPAFLLPAYFSGQPTYSQPASSAQSCHWPSLVPASMQALPTRPSPTYKNLPAHPNPLPASGGRPAPPAGSRGQCGSASAIADWS